MRLTVCLNWLGFFAYVKASLPYASDAQTGEEELFFLLEAVVGKQEM